MIGPHAAAPAGVPAAWPWAQHAEVGDVSNGTMEAMTGWGQIYAEAGASEPASGSVRIEIKDIRSYIWSKSERRWALVQDSPEVAGAHYFEDFRGNVAVPADTQREPDGGTSVSMVPGYNFHFWPLTGRAGVSPGDVTAVITTYDARLLGAGAAQARYIANAGADWWRTTGAPFSGTAASADNDGIGEGRFVQLCPTWGTIAFYTGGP